MKKATFLFNRGSRACMECLPRDRSDAKQRRRETRSITGKVKPFSLQFIRITDPKFGFEILDIKTGRKNPGRLRRGVTSESDVRFGEKK